MTDPAPTAPSRWRRRVRSVIVLLVAAGLLSSPWWARRALGTLDFFHVREVELFGLRYASPADLMAVLAVDTTRSVWDDPSPLVRRLESHSQVRQAEIRRKLPSTLVIHIQEQLPIALASGDGGLEPVDVAGNVLPLDPSRTAPDLPLVAGADSAVLRLLDQIRAADPTLFRRISEVRRVDAHQLLIQLASVPVRVAADVTPARLADVIPVEDDLVRRGIRVSELDLRFRDQVIARVQ